MEWWAAFWGFTVDEYEEFLDMATETLQQEPSVRCKDCKHIELKDFVNGTCKYRTGKVTPDGFCERGEKR